MLYSNLPNNFEYLSVYDQTYRSATRNTKEYYLRAGYAPNLPIFLRLLNFYLMLNDRIVYTPTKERITRSTGLDYYFRNLTQMTEADDPERTYNIPLLYTTAQREAFNAKDIFAIHLIEVAGQIQDVFERAIPEWAREHNAVEQLGVSLTLKLTPKHRVRVYTRNEHIIVFTTKGLRDELYETDFRLHRNLWACIPLLRGWVPAEGEPECPDIIELCKALGNNDATDYWTLLNLFCSTNQALKDLKYSSIIQTFNNIKATRVSVIERRIAEYNNNAADYLTRYAQTLDAKKAEERQLLELQQTDTPLEKDTIKMLVDKKICYDLDISALNTPDGTISFRCSAPLLAYDKDAARIVYNKQVKNNHNKLEKIFKLLFVDEQVVLLFTQVVDVKLNRSTFNARNGYTRMYNDRNTSFPNPHHYCFNCWGSYGPVITKLISEYKLEEMFFQIKAATGSLNFTDYPVISNFLEMLYYIVDGDYDPPCFLWRDENCTTAHTLNETLKHFKEEATE